MYLKFQQISEPSKPRIKTAAASASDTGSDRDRGLLIEWLLELHEVEADILGRQP